MSERLGTLELPSITTKFAPLDLSRTSLLPIQWVEEEQMLLLTCYLASAAVFYYLVARNAPIVEETVLAHAGKPAQGEVIEIFPDHADRTASRAA